MRFLRELIGFSRIAHIVSAIDSGCFIGTFSTFVFDKRTYCTLRQRCLNKNRLKNVGVFFRAYLFSEVFYKRIHRISNTCLYSIHNRFLMLNWMLLIFFF